MVKPRKSMDRNILERLYIHEKQSPKQIAEFMRCSRQTIINRLREYGLPVRTKGEGTALAKVIYPRADFNGTEVEKAYLLGLRIGDLTVDLVNPGGQTIRISCASTRSEQISLIEKLFQPYGRVLLNGPYLNNRVFIQCLVNLSFVFLLEKPNYIPEWITTKSENFWSFLGGYSDAEAHVGTSNKKSSYRLGTADEKILMEIHWQISLLGIECPKPYIWLKKGSENKLGIKNNKDIWRLGIYRKESLRSFLITLLPNLRHKKRIADVKKVLTILE